jgi:hypothetical protein
VRRIPASVSAREADRKVLCVASDVGRQPCLFKGKERLDVHSTLLDGVLQREVGVPSMIVLLVGGRSLPPSRLLCSPLISVGGGGRYDVVV